MTVSFKAPVKSAVVNNAFVSKQANDVKVGQLGLNKASEGNQIFSVQKSVNELFDVTGTGEGDPNAKNYNNNNYVADGDSHKTAIEKLDAQAKNNADTISDHVGEVAGAHAASAISFDNVDSELVAINVQDAIDEVEARLDTAEADISDHIDNETDAHDASAISYVNTASELIADDVQSAIDEVESRLGTAESDIQAIEDSIGQASGIAPLNGSSKIDATYLPSYVDDVLEYADFASLPVSGETGKIYVTLDTNKTYRWTGSIYVEISASPVTSVNSQTGVVVLNADNIAETSTRYWSKKNNVANSMPLVTNDSSQNYSIGSQWYDAINDTLYICEDATIGAAVWQPISGAGGGVGSVDIMFADTFENTDIADYTITQPFASISAVSPLQGENSLLILHDHNPSYYIERIIPIDNKFKNKNVTFTLDVSSNAPSGDLTLSVWDHTNTVQLLNSELIQPQEADQTSVKRSFSFNIPSGANELRYRINVLFDSGKVSRVDNLVIELTETAKLSTTIETPIITEWQSYVPSFQGFGTPTNIEFQWRQNGENVEVRGKFTSGTSTAIEARVGLPNGYTSADSSKIPSISNIGTYTQSVGLTGNGRVLIEPAVSYLTFGYELTGAAGLTKANASTFISSGTSMSLFASTPIQGLMATETQSVSLAQTVLVQESDTALRINRVLGYGSTNTRVVRFDPTGITDNVGDAVTYIPSATLGDSFKINKKGIYNISCTIGFQTTTGNAYPYIVKNPSIVNQSTGSSIPIEEVLVHAYTHGGASGNPDMNMSATVELEVDDVIWATNPVASPVALQTDNRSHFQITYQGSLKQLNVSENQKIEIPTSELRMEGASTRGSTATAIVRFDNIAKLRGDAFTVESTAALGTVITMKKKGKLDISTTLQTSTYISVQITKNQQGSLTALSSTASEIIATSLNNASGPVANNATHQLSSSIFVEAGDIFRVAQSVVAGTPYASTNNSLNLSFQEQEVSVSVTNVLPQFSESDSSVRVDTANGYGSTATKIRRFSTVRTNIGTAVTYADSATDGASFTINESGLYHLSYTDELNSAQEIGISLNADSTDRTTNYGSLAKAKRLTVTSANTNFAACSAASVYLQAGDVVRAHSSGTANGDQENAYFIISKVGKPNVTGVDVTPFAKIEYEVSQEFHANKGVTGTGVVTGYTITKNTNNGLFSFNNSTGVMTFLKRCKVNVSASSFSNTGGSYITINVNGVTGSMTDRESGTFGFNSVSDVLTREVGDTLSVSIPEIGASSVVLRVVATELRDAYQVIGGGVENTYSARITSAGAITTQSYPFIESVSKGGTGVYNITFKAGFFTQAPSVIPTVDTNAGNAAVAITSSITTSGCTISTVNVSDVLVDKPFNLQVTRQGSDYRTPSKAIGLPAQRIAVLTEEYVSGTAAQTTSATYAARRLNTIKGDSSLLVNASSFTGVGGTNATITLSAGTYYIDFTSQVTRSATTGSLTSKMRIQNTTDNTTLLVGTTALDFNTSGGQPDISSCRIMGYFTLTSQKNIEIQQRSSAGTERYGDAASYGDNEVYLVGSITKVEE